MNRPTTLGTRFGNNLLYEDSEHILAAQHDTFFSPASLQDATAAWTATTHDVVAGADHFFIGHETGEPTRSLAALCARAPTARDPVTAVRDPTAGLR